MRLSFLHDELIIKESIRISFELDQVVAGSFKVIRQPIAKVGEGVNGYRLS